MDMFPRTKTLRRLFFIPQKPDDYISVKIGYADDIPRTPDRVTYKLIQEYVEEKYGFVHTAYIAEVKRSLGLETFRAPNA